MKSKEIQKHIDRVVGTEGIFRIPSWWMHKILSDLVKYCEDNEGASSIKSYIESQLNLIGEEIDGLDERLKNVENHELFEIVSKLPSEPKDNTIYLIPSQNGEDNNVLTEWVYINDSWEKLGEFKVQLDQELYAYPVDTLDGKENKVVELGSDTMYQYVGELVASKDGYTEGELTNEAFYTSYCYQPIYDGKYLEYFEEFINEEYITLYIGDDVDGYTSNKVYISKDANNLTYYSFNFIGGFGPRILEVAISQDHILHYRNYYHYANKNSKVFFASSKQQLDINLIPQEIARKEDLATEINNHEYPILTIDAVNLTYEGDIESKTVRLNINISSYHFDNNTGTLLNKHSEDERWVRYGNDYILIVIDKTKKNVVTLDLTKPAFTTYDLDNFDYKNCSLYGGRPCTVIHFDTGYPATIDLDDYVTTLINGKYFKYKLNRETHLLELQSEIDLSSIESRLAALEAKLNTV